VDSGADLVVIHLEAMATPYETIFAAKEYSVGVGVAITLGTSLALFEPVAAMVDAVLLLSRVTGEGARGAAYNPLVVPRVRAARQMIDAAGREVDLQVAGGVNRDHVAELVDAGATSLALGGGLYRVPDMAAEVAAIRGLATREG
jgi:ribulose-phosphate 3-epimerase